MSSFSIEGNIVDIPHKRTYTGKIRVDQGRIGNIQALSETTSPHLPYLLPGFVDSHVHIESSMLAPAEFARLAVVHGTTAVISDPHEIANVCGMEGIQFMIRNGRSVNFKFYFGAPSCVPATPFETAGAAISTADIKQLLQQKEILYLSEMMNFPGVLSKDEEVMQKIKAAHEAGKPVDGHAPGLRGDALKQYAAAGITTDHECFTREEAVDKLQNGMKILIREGSAARNFDTLADLVDEFPDKMMFCSDDKHPDSLVKGHINELCKRAVAKGIDPYKVLQAACLNPVAHYGLDLGILRAGDPADFIAVRDLNNFEVLKTYINGELVAENGVSYIRTSPMPAINRFSCDAIKETDLLSPATNYVQNGTLPVIEALDGQLITRRLNLPPKLRDGFIVSDTERDILKMVVINRYTRAAPAIAFIRNFQLKTGAIASSVAHDSHNIIAVGADDKSLCAAINLVIREKGGVSCVSPGKEAVIALPIAGLMSGNDGYAIARAYTQIDQMAKSLGSGLSAPFMTLSFMALLVIPSLKLSDLGLFDGDGFRFIYRRPDTAPVDRCD
ncbi:MAG TPA: adenine deaminase [Flavitalea sp.]|nr:adenine deaminase [Flavitalea sp.]